MKHALVFAVLTAAVSAQTWATLNPAPTTSPAMRRNGAMAFDAIGNRLIMYGGLTVSPTATTSQTWAFNGTWSLLAPTGNVPARWGHRMVRNPATNELFTFGGRSPLIMNFASDTWKYLGSAGVQPGSWTQVSTTNAPNPRHLYGLTFDTARGVAILFGGSNATTAFGDTWEFNPQTSTWTLRTFGAATPPARDDMVLVYDAALNRTVMFGGYDFATGLPLGDTWLYDGTNWEPHTTAASPSARYSSAAIYDTVRQRVVLYGGFDDVGPNLWERDTWEFAGGTWNSLGSALAPNSSEAYAGFDPVRRKFVLHGGFGASGFVGQTWEMSTPTGAAAGQTGLFGTFAEACSALGQPPTISAGVPTINQTFQTTIDSLPSPTIVGRVLGFSNQSFSGLPLPLNLSAIGINCNLYVSVDYVDVTFDLGPGPTPPQVFSLPIPNNPALINVVLYTQGLVWEYGTTAPARMVIGTP